MLGGGGARRWLYALGAGLVTIAAAVMATPSCIFAFSQNSLGNGTGCVTGVLNVPDCWSGNFNLQPDFFVGVPYQAPGVSSLDIRVQRGSDFETFSDGLAVLVDDVTAIRPGPDGGTGLYGVPLSVSIPAGVTAPGVPLAANPNPSPVHVSLYLQNSCQTENVSVYALEEVSLSADGSCNGVPADSTSFLCGVTPAPADAGAESGPIEAGVDGSTADGGAPLPVLPVGHSTITFTSLFDDNPDESSAEQRLTQATFDLYLADPRSVAPGGLGPPPMCQAHIQGSFSFYFQRGQPGQPFP
jgi:hypothetical protein